MAEAAMVPSDYAGMEPSSSSTGCEGMGEEAEQKSEYLMNREQEFMPSNVKKEEVEEAWEKLSVKLESGVGVKAVEGPLKMEEKERDEWERHGTDQLNQTRKLMTSEMKSIYGQQVGGEPSLLVNSCLLKQPRVLIHRLEIANDSILVPSPPCAVALNLPPSTSENGICAEASLTSPLMTSRSQNTGQTVEESSQIFTCTLCPFFHAERADLKKHIEKVHPEELSRGSLPPPSSPHQDPSATTTLSILTGSYTNTPGAKTDSQCGKHFKTEWTLNTQKKTCERERPYWCTHCDKTFTDSSKLKAHQQIHTGEFPFVCSRCGKGFSYSANLKVHERIHTGERPYRCAECGKSFNQLGTFKYHQQTHTGERPFLCTLCGKSFTELRSLKQHQDAAHTLNPPHLCFQCGRSFTQLRSLRCHQKMHTGERLYRCSQCDKSFISAGNLKVHERLHTGERPYQCSQCDKSFNRADYLKAHQRIHSGEHQFHCSQCDKTFTTSNYLKMHMRFHTGECPYLCSQCGKSFIGVASFKRHQQKHTGEHSYQRSHCGKSFYQADNRKTHQRVHNGECPYHCSQCGLSFTESISLQEHQELIHVNILATACSVEEISAS